MIDFVEYTETTFAQQPLTLFFDGYGDTWIRRQALVEVFDIKTTLVRRLDLPKAVIQSPAGAFVVKWQQACEFVVENGGSDVMLASMQKMSAELENLPRQPHEKPEILKRSEIDRHGTALAVRSDVPPMPQAVKTADDVSVYTENLR